MQRRPVKAAVFVCFRWCHFNEPPECFVKESKPIQLRVLEVQGHGADTHCFSQGLLAHGTMAGPSAGKETT